MTLWLFAFWTAANLSLDTRARNRLLPVYAWDVRTRTPMINQRIGAKYSLTSPPLYDRPSADSSRRSLDPAQAKSGNAARPQGHGHAPRCSSNPRKTSLTGT